MRKICVVTGTRADYGLLRPLMRCIDQSTELQLQVIVTGSHLSEFHGNTYQEIENDGFSIDWRVPILAEDDSDTAIAHAFGRAVTGMSNAIVSLSPDIIVLLGDRYEALAAGVAATICRKPIAHVHGGEATRGLIDEAFRHSLTKMAHLHFVSAEAYRHRVLQMGENPGRVWCVGALGLDGIAELNLLTPEELGLELDVSFGTLNFLVTFHPVTLQPGKARAQVMHLVKALKSYPEARIFITMPNAESESSEIRAAFREFRLTNPDRIFVFESLGQLRYLSVLKRCDVVIGNSSSGLIEAPSLGTPTVNIGDRQRGRLRGSSVFDVQANASSIEEGIRGALMYAATSKTQSFFSPYGEAGASRVISDVLAQCDLDDLLDKSFVDWG